MDTMNTVETITMRSELLASLALAADVDRFNRWALHLVAVTGDDEGYATDGKRLHATAGAIAEGAEILARVDSRAVTAIMRLQGDRARESDLMEIEDGSVKVGEYRISTPVKEGIPADTVRDTCASQRKRATRLASVPKWKGKRFGQGKQNINGSRTTGDRPLTPREGGASVSVLAEKHDKVRVLIDDAGRLELSWRVQYSPVTPEDRKGIWINPAFLRDAAAFVGDACFVFLPEEDDQSAVVLVSRDEKRFALIMPINVS